MESKVSKSQLEVWEWKEKVYEEIKDLPCGKQTEYIQKKNRSTIEWIKKHQAEKPRPG